MFSVEFIAFVAFQSSGLVCVLQLNSWFLCSNGVKRRVGKHNLIKLQLIVWKHSEALRMSHKTHLVRATSMVFNWNSVYFWSAKRHLDAFLWKKLMNLMYSLNIIQLVWPILCSVYTVFVFVALNFTLLMQ